MDYNKFEKHIADVLRQEQTEMDIDALIRDLHNHKKERRYPALIWISGVLALVLISSGLYITNHQNSQKTVIASTKIENNPDKNFKDKLSVTENDQQSQPNLSPISTVKSKFNTTENATKSDAQNFTTTDNTISSSFSSTGKNKSLKDFSSDNFQSRKIDKYLNIFEGQNNQPTNSINNSTEYQQITINNRRQVNITSLAFSPENLSASILGKIKTGNVICPTFHKKGRFTLDIIPEIGYFRPLKKLQYDGNEPNNIYTLRNQNESTLEGLNAGIYFRLMNDKLPVFVQAGTTFSRMTEKMPLDYAYTKRDTTRGIISITQSQSGDTVTVIYGDIIQENKISGRKTSHHHFTMIDLPLSVGFEKSFGAWSGGIEGGVIVNLSLIAGGQILASDTSFTAIDQPVDAYKSRLGLSYFGGLFIARNFDRFGKFYVALRGRYIPDSFSSDHNRIKQSYHMVGLNAGYVYSF